MQESAFIYCFVIKCTMLSNFFFILSSGNAIRGQPLIISLPSILYSLFLIKGGNMVDPATYTNNDKAMVT